MSAVLDALIAIQRELKAPKDQSAKKYRYRNIEDINELVKPIACANNCAVVYTDEFKDGICVSTCKLISSDGEISAQGVSRIDMKPEYMSIEQACGAASSYARKFAACGLFAIDSSENDPDKTNAWRDAKSPSTANVADVGNNYEAKKRAWHAMTRYAELNGLDPNEIAEDTKSRANFSDTEGFWIAVAEEFEYACG